ncbi:phenylalanine--tRNA ligase subunit beta [Mycoplasma crocodyli]|uniref:Phenylalanine--tRNA ligase beta subunit n=1 Tax=Mycoplasma crocodyli (strain ATCC 51981 / MP145) TaxID=512564 RepID=D5E5B6_MYCCM|nr:phenylalanine--tRNA ligase subunit beta [Mycoplasma crocodyli]ADE19818.1 phenylalanyl-tRNA synthetase, beta subunit [Mycoplasma crocodyli MP145]
MIFSLKKLNTYLPGIKLNKDVEQVINKLGFEVESIKKFSTIEGVVFGLIKELYKNPNSDLLTVATVETKHGNLTIQTTDNVLKVDDLVVCFIEGSKMGDIVFKTKNLKNIPSQGMFASYEELGFDGKLFGDLGEHILRLDKNFASINDDPMQVLQLDDYILDVSTTANRNDANSYYVMAKELAAYYETEFVFNEKNHKGSLFSDIAIDRGMSNEITMFQAYCDKEFDLNIFDKMLLAKHNIDTSLGWAVNLTNLVLIITGAPCHVYDKNKIGLKITSELYSGKLKLLGNKDVDVENVLIIRDENKPISVASVMGLETTKVDEKTKEFIFEIGVFDPTLIRHSVKQIKLLSNSANQASRTITNEILELGILFLRKYLNDNKISISNLLGIPKIGPKKMIKFDKEKLSVYSDQNTSSLKKFIPAIEKLKKLGFSFDLEVNEVYVPIYRYDINYFEDIIEEIFRFYSYDNFEPVQLSNTSFKIHKRSTIKHELQANGYNEILTYSLLSKQKNFLNVFDFQEELALETFVSKEREVIRNSIIPSMLEAVEYNQKRKINKINFFEVGMINNNISVVGLASTTKSFEEIKEDIIKLYRDNKLVFEKLDNNEKIHPNVSAKIYQNNLLIGWIGKVNPKYDLTNAYVAEVLVPQFNSNKKYKIIDNEPLKSIDLTFGLKHGESIKSYVKDINNNFNVYDIELKDTFEKNNLINTTLRITSDSKTIELINKKYNK